MPRDLGLYFEESPPSWVTYATPVIDVSSDRIHADGEAYPRLAQALEAFNAESAAVRTDDKTFVDILTQDGRLWRIDRQTDGEWTSTIWGEDENGYFSDIVYAG